MQPSIPLPAPLQSSTYRYKIRHLLFFCLLAIVSFSLDASAQVNLVNNPSFEIMYNCPLGISDLGDQLAPNCANWFSANAATPDYFHSCTQATVCGVSPYANYIYMAGVPQNTFGYQNAFNDPADPNDTQNAYAGIVYVPSQVSDITRNRREYIEVSLSSALDPGQFYEVSFYVSLADGSSYALTDLGAYLSVGAIVTTGSINALGVSPQIHDNTQFFTDKDNWVQIKGTYQAVGGEDHLVIGYFRNTLSFGTDFTDVPIDAGDTSCYAKALPAYGEFAYYYIDGVSVKLLCEYCGEDAYTVTAVADSSHADEEECCFKLDLTRKSGACDIGNIRISFLPIAVPEPSYNAFNDSYTVAGNWSKTSSSSSSVTWTRDPNADPQPVDVTETAGGFCIRKFNVLRTIVIEYLDDDMNYMCSDTVELPLCYTPSCCDSLNLQIEGAAYYLPDYCCFSVFADASTLCSRIDSIRIESQTNEPIFLLSDPTQTASSFLTFGRVTLEGQEFIGGNICLSSASLSSFDVRIEYLDAEGSIICVIDTTLRCNCCVGLRTFKGDMCSTIPEGTDPEACCRSVYITQDTGVKCKVYGVVLTGASGGVALQSTPIVFPPSGASGSLLQCYGSYCLEPGETRTILIDFLDSLGYVFCTKAITDTCDERSCCDSISLGFEFPFYPPWNVPDQCCASIYAVQPSGSECEIYGVNVINAQGGISYDPTRRISFTNCGNCVRTIVASYCLEPGETRTITIQFLDISGNVMCTKTVVRSCPAVDSCCDKLKAEFIPVDVVGPQPRCCMDIKITKQPGLSCDVYGIRLTGASGGVALQGTPITIPTGNPSNPNTLIVGQVCCPYGQSRTVTIEFLDANGEVLCSKTISFSCPANFGGGTGGSGKTGAPSGTDIAVPRLQAMPNPTVGNTTIQYYLPADAPIRLEVYNSLGRLVAVPEEGFRTMGEHRVTYTTDELPSGVYYLKLEMGNNVLTIPLVVTKK